MLVLGFRVRLVFGFVLLEVLSLRGRCSATLLQKTCGEGEALRLHGEQQSLSHGGVGAEPGP